MSDVEDDYLECTTISNVPQELVDQFREAFPDQPKLCEWVRTGGCDHVGDILKRLGDQDEETGEYHTFNEAQQAAADSWWHLYNDVWFSK